MSPTVLLLAAAAALFLWPRSRPVPVGELRVPPPVDATTGRSRLTYQAALLSLADVRLRLVQTQQLTDETRSAIDRLTLALVTGSDVE